MSAHKWKREKNRQIFLWTPLSPQNVKDWLNHLTHSWVKWKDLLKEKWVPRPLLIALYLCVGWESKPSYRKFDFFLFSPLCGFFFCFLRPLLIVLYLWVGWESGKPSYRKLSKFSACNQRSDRDTAALSNIDSQKAQNVTACNVSLRIIEALWMHWCNWCNSVDKSFCPVDPWLTLIPWKRNLNLCHCTDFEFTLKHFCAHHLISTKVTTKTIFNLSFQTTTPPFPFPFPGQLGNNQMVCSS